MREILAKRLTGPLRWYGGKWRLAPKLLPLIPDHEIYVEVFAGSAALFFAKKPQGIEVLNDKDEGVMNLFTVLRDREMFTEFQRVVHLTPYSLREYAYCQSTWRDCKDPVEKARRFFFVNRACHNGVMSAGFGREYKGGRKGMTKAVSTMLNTIDRLPEIAARLRGALLDCADFRKIIKRYDAPGTLFYLDPPYVHSTRRTPKGYAHEMSDSDHEDLVELLLGIEGKAMLSGYDHPIYGPLECAGWRKHEFSMNCSVAALYRSTNVLDEEDANERYRRTECVWVRA